MQRKPGSKIQLAAKQKDAKNSFLAALNADSRFDKAKLQLGLLYFYGYGKNNEYSVLGRRVTVDQEQFRDKAISLLKEYQTYRNEDTRSYFCPCSRLCIKRPKSSSQA